MGETVERLGCDLTKNIFTELEKKNKIGIVEHMSLEHKVTPMHYPKTVPKIVSEKC